jgi:WD40 repeat protein
VLPSLRGDYCNINSVAFSPDGSKIVSGSSDGSIRVWDAGTGVQVLPSLQGHYYNINSVAFSPEGSKTVSGSNEIRVRKLSALPNRDIANYNDFTSSPHVLSQRDLPGDHPFDARVQASLSSEPSMVAGLTEICASACLICSIEVQYSFIVSADDDTYLVRAVPMLSFCPTPFMTKYSPLLRNHLNHSPLPLT